jgi:hypothetical protein
MLQLADRDQALILKRMDHSHYQNLMAHTTRGAISKKSAIKRIIFPLCPSFSYDMPLFTSYTKNKSGKGDQQINLEKITCNDL